MSQMMRQGTERGLESSVGLEPGHDGLWVEFELFPELCRELYGRALFGEFNICVSHRL